MKETINGLVTNVFKAAISSKKFASIRWQSKLHEAQITPDVVPAICRNG